jgi:hypothetical protein
MPDRARGPRESRARGAGRGQRRRPDRSRAAPQVPARIAWYTSSNPGRDDKTGSVIAVFLFVEVDIATPDVLFQVGSVQVRDMKSEAQTLRRRPVPTLS